MKVPPAWHAEALEMRARGLTLGQIAQRFGVHHTTVLHAVSPERREYARRKASQYARRKWHNRRARGGWAVLADAMDML